MDSLSENIDVIVFEKELNEKKEIEDNDVNDKNHQKEADVKIMHKKVCFGCEETIFGNNEEELNKMFWKVHWDNQNPFLEKCDFCETIFHAETEDLVKKRLLEHEKICKDNNEKEDFEGYLDDNDSFIATCHLCEISFNDNDEDSVNKRFLEHEKICKGNNDKEDVEGNLDDNDNDNNYQEEHKDSILFINELLIDEIKKSSMSLKEKSKLLKPLKFLKDEKTCKGNNEKEDVEGDLDDNDKKIKKMQMKNHNCKTPPPPPPPTPPTKEPSNFLKPHRPTKTMKAVVKIKKLLLPTPSSKKLFYPSPTKGPSNLLKPHRPTKTMKAVLKIKKLSLLKMVDEIKKLQIPLKEKSKILKSLKLSFKQCKNCEFITEDTCILEEHELINHQRVEVSIHIQSNSPQAESESEAIVPLNIETSPCEEVGNTQQLSNRPSSSYPLTLSIFHKSMRCKKGIELDKKKMKMKINKMRNFLKFNIDEDVSQPNVHQIIPPASNNFSVDLHLKWIQNKLRKNREYNASQKESEKEVIIPLNIETPPEGMDNTQQLSTRSLSPVDEVVIQSNASQTEPEKEDIIPSNIETLLPERVDNTQKLSTRSLSPMDEVVIQSNAPQTEAEKEDIIPSNIETLLPEVDNTQQFSTRPSSTVDSKYSFFFHKSLRKQGTKRKFNLDEDDNEENVERPRKMMRMGMKIIWNKYRIHWGRLGHHRSQRRA